MARKERETALDNEVAPKREGVGLGAVLHCACFDTGEPADGEVVGGGGEHDLHYRIRIDALGGQEWLVKKERVDPVARTWEHVAGDYPALGADAAFDKEFRAYLTAPAREKPALSGAADRALADLAKHLPPEVAATVVKVVRGAKDKMIGGPAGSVLARWTGKGTLDAPYLARDTRELTRGAPNGTEGWFSQKTVGGRYKDSFVLL